LKKATLIFIVLPSLLLAQKSTPRRSSIHPIDQVLCAANYSIVKLNGLTIEQYLTRNISNLRSPGVSIRPMEIIPSISGNHFLFQQYYNNVAVYRGTLKVNTDKQGNITSVFNNSINTNLVVSEVFPGVSVSANFLISKSIPTAFTEKTYFLNEGVLMPLLRTVITSGREHYETMLASSGEVIYSRDLNCYYNKPSAQDSTVSATVFLPDPLTTAGVVYGIPYKDNSDADVTQINAERKTVSMKVDFNNDTFKLQGSFAAVKEFDSPVTVPAICKTTANFNYTRAQQEFEDVNAFFHITTFHDYIKSLGFNNIVNYPIAIDAHAMGGSDNSMFSPGFSPPRLYYGEGGVDDAEDADVIIHEYGHAVAHSAAPNTNSGTQRQTLDEANGDYLAASYSRPLNAFNWDMVFSWDGHNEFWNGRNCLTTKLYPGGLVNDIYDDADIWSATLMQIWSDIGQQTSDKILIESIYSYSPGMTMPMAAQLFIKADSTLNSGANYLPICNRFFNRGLVSSCAVGINENTEEQNIQLIGSKDFSEGKETTILLPGTSNGTIQLFDIGGRLLFSDNISTGSYKLSGKSLNPGVYILSVQSGVGNKNFKLLKF